MAGKADSLTESAFPTLTLLGLHCLSRFLRALVARAEVEGATSTQDCLPECKLHSKAYSFPIASCPCDAVTNFLGVGWGGSNTRNLRRGGATFCWCTPSTPFDLFGVGLDDTAEAAVRMGPRKCGLGGKLHPGLLQAEIRAAILFVFKGSCGPCAVPPCLLGHATLHL